MKHYQCNSIPYASKEDLGCFFIEFLNAKTSNNIVIQCTSRGHQPKLKVLCVVRKVCMFLTL